MNSEQKQRQKSAGVVEEYTHEQLLELEKCAVDPIYFIETYVKVVDTVKGLVPFKLFAYQRRMIEAYNGSGELNNPTLASNEGDIKDPYQFTVVMTSRQMGKTVVAAAYLLWYAMFKEYKTVLVASKGMSHAKEIMSRIKRMYEELPSWLKPGVIYYSTTQVAFDNESKIISEATTENTGRGHSISLLYLDEFAFCDASIQTEMWASIFPTLSSGGRLIVTSTPRGDEDLFAEFWRGAWSGTNKFNPLFVNYWEHPNRPKDGAWSVSQRSQLGELLYRQEVLCEFLTDEELLISSMLLTTTKVREPVYEFNGIKVFVPKEKVGGPGKMYLMAVDPSTGRRGDYTAISVYDAYDLSLVARLRRNDLDPTAIYQRILFTLSLLTNVKRHMPKNAYDDYCRTGEDILSRDDSLASKYRSTVIWTFERNGVGEAIVDRINNDEGMGIWMPGCELVSDDVDSGKLGLYTTPKEKLKACLTLKSLIERDVGGMEIGDRELLSELKSYVANKNSYEAKRGGTDDVVSSMLLITRCISYAAQLDEDLNRLMFANSNEVWRASANRDQELLIDAYDAEDGDGAGGAVSIDAWL
jgi:hypothetical protein